MTIPNQTVCVFCSEWLPSDVALQNKHYLESHADIFNGAYCHAGSILGDVLKSLPGGRVEEIPGQPGRQLYQFPATRFTANSLWRQWWHLLSEVLEVGLALLAGNLQHAAAEVYDVKHCGETLHRILSGRGADIGMAKETVIDNNEVRGYYLKPDNAETVRL